MGVVSDIKRGFAAMSPEVRSAICSIGGTRAHAMGRAHTFTPEQARKAGRKGGLTVAARAGHMREIGRLGGLAVSKNIVHMRAIGKKGGQATVDLKSAAKLKSAIGAVPR